MITLDTGTFFVLLVASAAAGALVAVLPSWRHLMDGGASLPVWGFLRRRRDPLPQGHAALQAQVRCEMCASQSQCRGILADGGRTPVAGCPNEALFQAELKGIPCVRT